MNWRLLSLVGTIAAILLGTACGGGSIGTKSTGPTNYTISGTVSGLSGSGLVLQDNKANNLPISANGVFTFGAAVSAGSTYSVTVLTEPTNPTQTCTVSNSSGTANANVTNVTVTCSTTTYTISGTVSGLSGSGLVLQDNGKDNLTIKANGTFTFPTAVASGSAYSVTVLTQPSNPAQTCTVSNGTGTANANVTNVSVTCSTTTYTIGGTVSGLAGTGLVLQNNGGNNLAIAGNGSFTFTTPVSAGGTYAVTVLTQPSNPAQTCTVANGTGTANANVTNIAVTCSTTTYTIGGNVSGLAGTGLVLQNNGGNNLSIAANGSFTFSAPVSAGSTYAVTVLTQPSNPAQTCTVSNGTGTANANVTTVSVTCATTTYTIGGMVSGLAGTGLVLQNNGGNNLSIAANGSFTFTTPVNAGSAYNVTVLTQPTGPIQACVVTNGSGIANANVTTVTVTCTTTTYTIGGTLSGLATSTTVVIADNSTDQLILSANGSFTFANPIQAGNTYSVTVLTQPSGQNCTVANGSGTANANVTNVSVTCAPLPTFSIGGTLSGLSGGTVVLQDNGTDNLSLSANGVFTFATKLQSGSSYDVTVLTQPTGQTCSVTNGTGVVTANVTNVQVTCVSGNTVAIGGTLYDLSSNPSTTGVVLQNNGSDNLSLTLNGPFVFSTSMTNGSTYAVTVLTQPTGPEQNCTVLNGSGTANGNVANVEVVCIGEWTWVFGLDTVGGVGSYGSTANPSNDPGARNGAFTWIDASGNLWLFGGIGYDSTGSTESLLSDLWEFTNGGWIWINGAQSVGQPPVYPTNGKGNPGTPGARAYGVSWVDSSGNFWMFGGYGLDIANSAADTMNDLWEFTGGQWIYQGGSETQGQQGTYGTKGTSGGFPGARYYATGYTDASGNLWMLGGYGVDSQNQTGFLNDLWEFSGGAWTWQSGSNKIGQKGSYGTLNQTSASNVPGARIGASAWIDSTGTFWLFGGDGVDSNNVIGELNDLWTFSGNEWTWVGGANTNNVAGTYGTQGIPDPSNTPGSRMWAMSWLAPNGDVWLFGGERTGGGLFNDLWKYSGGQWTFMDPTASMNGTQVINQTGVYPTQIGLGPSPTNAPGSRMEGASWTDASGNLWLFGGYGLASVPNTFDSMNDLWEFQP